MPAENSCCCFFTAPRDGVTVNLCNAVGIPNNLHCNPLQRILIKFQQSNRACRPWTVRPVMLPGGLNAVQAFQPRPIEAAVRCYVRFWISGARC
jgi:hypothetical protein